MSLENLEWKYLTIGGAPIVQNPKKTYVLKVVDTEPEPVKKWYQKLWEKLKNLLGKLCAIFSGTRHT
jgi:CRISPR/Cas system-associated protein Cas7 (RAMP superfamily)